MKPLFFRVPYLNGKRGFLSWLRYGTWSFATILGARILEILSILLKMGRYYKFDGAWLLWRRLKIVTEMGTFLHSFLTEKFNIFKYFTGTIKDVTNIYSAWEERITLIIFLFLLWQFRGRCFCIILLYRYFYTV